MQKIDWSKPIICLDGTTAQYVHEFVHNGNNDDVRFRGRYNSTGDLYHEIHWDEFGRMYGSNGTPLDDFRLNVKNI